MLASRCSYIVILCNGMTNAAGEIIFVAFGVAVTDACAAAVSRVASENTIILVRRLLGDERAEVNT